MSAAYSGTPLPKKLGIVGDVVFTVRHAPADFADTLGDVGEAIWQQHMLPTIDVVVAFFTERAKLAKEWQSLVDAAGPEGAIWIAWPKRASGIATDITEDVLRSELLRTGWVDNKVCAIDEVWSGLRFVLRKKHRPPRKR